MVRKALPLALVFALVPLLGSTAPLSAQTLSGLVAEQFTLDAVEGAVVTLFQVSEDGAFTPVATAVTDEEGAFSFTLSAPGSYRAQAEFDGFTSPMSHAMGFTDDSVLDDLVLILPSPLLLLATQCDLDANPGAVVVGTVRDGGSDVPIPGARVVGRWETPSGGGQVDAETDARGHFVLCGVEPVGQVEFRGEALGRLGYWTEVGIERTALVFHDVEVTLGTTARIDSDPAIDFIMMEIAGTLGSLSGELRDQDSGEPIVQAVVRLEGTRLQTVTDAEGRFMFPDLPPGSYALHVQHLGYSVVSREVEVPEGRNVLARMALSPQAIELEGVSVTARSRLEQDVRISPFRRQVVHGQELALAEQRGAMALDVMRANFPGLRVRERHTEYVTQLCVEGARRIQSLERPGDDVEVDPYTACQDSMVMLVVDGTRIGAYAMALYLQSIPASDVESIEYLQPTQAATLYGVGASASNGVIVIWTRGKGPYVSGARNR